MLTVTPAPWHCSHWYRRPDLVPAPAHVLHLMFRDSDSFLRTTKEEVQRIGYQMRKRSE